MRLSNTRNRIRTFAFRFRTLVGAARRRVIGECRCVIELIFPTEQSNPWTFDVGINLLRGLKR